MGPGISGPAIEKWCDPAAGVGFDSCWVEPDPGARCSFPRHVPESNGTAQCTGKVAKTIHLPDVSCNASTAAKQRGFVELMPTTAFAPLSRRNRKKTGTRYSVP